MNPQGDGFTLMAWVKPEAVGDKRVIYKGFRFDPLDIAWELGTSGTDVDPNYKVFFFIFFFLSAVLMCQQACVELLVANPFRYNYKSVSLDRLSFLKGHFSLD